MLSGLLYLALGVLLLIAGSNWLLDGARGLALRFGISPFVIGLTVVAWGTSTPEFAATVAAALRREADIAIGNVVGSNTFNILGILGVTTVLRPISAAGLDMSDLVVMAGLSLVLLPLAITGARISRREGAILLSIYVVYTSLVLVRG